MDALLFLVIWLVHAAVGAALATPVLFFGRRRVAWTNWLLLALIIPFCVWMVLVLSPLSIGRRSFRYLGEPILISLAMPVLAIVRVAARGTFSQLRNAATLITVLCAVAVTAFFALPLWGAVSARGLTRFDRRIVDAHEQRYTMSCIPSSVEMVLKLSGRVPWSYCEQQLAWKNKADGSFHYFDGRTIQGLTFHQQFTQPHGEQFPLAELFETIHRELKAGRFVIVGLPAPGNDTHDWVIYDEGLDGEFLAMSKFGKWTIEQIHVRRVITRMRGTDIGTYEVKL